MIYFQSVKIIVRLTSSELLPHTKVFFFPRKYKEPVLPCCLRGEQSVLSLQGPFQRVDPSSSTSPELESEDLGLNPGSAPT